MLEEDRQIALVEPSKIVSQVEQAYMKARHPFKGVELRLQDPFDYISAEHIASDELLVSLFAESCPWAKDVTSPNPILLTGPRGCGKSMLFRRLSMKGLLYKTPDDIKNAPIAGFYLSCSAHVRNRFGWITSEVLAKRFQKEIVHYFNLLLTREVIQSLLFVSQRQDRESLFGFADIHEKELHDFLVERLGIKEDRRLRLQGVTPLEHILEIIEFEMNLCYQQFLRDFNLESTTPLSFLPDLTRFLKDRIGYFRDRAIAFLLDDFSVHRISRPVQLILNPIIWDRQSSHIFKLSAEKYGAERVFESQVDSAPTADMTREFREVDCGQHYIDLSDQGKTEELARFARELLDHRLALAGYKGNSDLIIGRSKYSEGNLGKHLVGALKAQDHYHGMETIAEICSGDVSALLEIYRNVFKDGKVTSQTARMVPRHVQHSAVTRVSRKFLEVIKTYHPLGDEMYQIVLHFGRLCRKILRYGKDMAYRDRPGHVRVVICETTRLEVDQIPEKSEDWPLSQQNLMKELVRRSIFIEMEPGRGRFSLGPTWRWQLRRIYCPAFATSLRKSTAIKWNTSDLKYFLTNPEDKCSREFHRWRDPFKTQRSLFSGTEEEKDDEDQGVC